MPKMNRRDFLKTASATAAGGTGLLTACSAENSDESGAPAVHTSKKYRWKMVTTWQPGFPVLGEGAELLARWVSEMTAGQLQIEVYGAGALVPALESFDAVQQGVAEMGHGASYYWAGKAAATQFFCAVPFGMNAQHMNSWLLRGGGIELWEEVYAPFNLIPMVCGNTGVQMGGWFNKEIRSSADIQGLKMRIPGLGGKVLKASGGTAVLFGGGEIFTNLERGVIDATEWIGPYHDYLKGFSKIAQFYHYPGWHEPGAVLELFVNKPAFENLPSHLQHVVRNAAGRLNTWILAEFERQNTIHLKKIIEEDGVQVLPFPQDVMDMFRQNTEVVIQDLIAEDPMSRKVYESFDRHRRAVGAWADVTEKVYYNGM